jgi:hypothetical protein
MPVRETKAGGVETHVNETVFPQFGLCVVIKAELTGWAVIPGSIRIAAGGVWKVTVFTKQVMVTSKSLLRDTDA